LGIEIDSPRHEAGLSTRRIGSARLVAADVPLMGYQRPKNVGRSGGVDHGQYAANRAIRAKYAQNYGQDCGAAD